MKLVLWCHSFVSCWNHGNVHFLRGIARELIKQGHEMEVYEPSDGWSRTNLLHDHGQAALREAEGLVPGVVVRAYTRDTLDLERALDGADVVLVHEWTDPALVGRIGRRRILGGRFKLFFHDTHHRAITAPHDLEKLDLDGYDGVLAFGEILRRVYDERGWGRRVFTWHEAADTALFRMDLREDKQHDLIWIGNWGDGERDAELFRFVLEPVARLALRARVHGVRYPERVRAELRRRNIDYKGWLANHRVPAAFASARATVHVPRRPYVEALRGIPTIRMFEALACGIPLVSAPWHDDEGLFPAGSYLTAKNADAMVAALSLILRDHDFATELARNGLHAIQTRHTCRHRVEQLLQIIETLAQPAQTRSESKMAVQ
jgi:spore maturation protein CgeB